MDSSESYTKQRIRFISLLKGEQIGSLHNYTVDGHAVAKLFTGVKCTTTHGG